MGIIFIKNQVFRKNSIVLHGGVPNRALVRQYVRPILCYWERIVVSAVQLLPVLYCWLGALSAYDRLMIFRVIYHD